MVINIAKNCFEVVKNSWNSSFKFLSILFSFLFFIIMIFLIYNTKVTYNTILTLFPTLKILTILIQLSFQCLLKTLKKAVKEN